MITKIRLTAANPAWNVRPRVATWTNARDITRAVERFAAANLISPLAVNVEHFTVAQ